MKIKRINSLFAVGLLMGAWSASVIEASEVDVRYPRVSAALNDGFYTLAEEGLLKILETNPEPQAEQEALALLAHALWGQQRYTDLLDLLEEYEESPELAYWRALAQTELQRFDEAMALIERNRDALEKGPYAAQMLRLSGRLFAQAGDLDTAIEQYKMFDRRFPAHPDALNNLFDLVDLYLRSGDRALAEVLLKQTMQSEVEQEKDRATLRYVELLLEEKTPEATAQARSLLRALATNEVVRLSDRIDGWVQLSALEEAEGELAVAQDALAEAVELSPDLHQRVMLRRSLASLFLRSGNDAKALMLLEECQAEAPDESLAALLQLSKADALLRSRNYEKAVDAYQVYLAVARNEDGMVDANFCKGLALLKLARFEEAATSFSKAAKEGSSKRAKALIKTADAYHRAGRFDESARFYREFIEAYPESDLLPQAMYQLGLCLKEMDKLDEAFELFSSVEERFQQSPFSRRAVLQIAEVLLKRRQWEQALERYVSIAATDTNRDVVALSRQQSGMLTYTLGRYEDALADFRFILKEFPDSEYAPQALYLSGFCMYRTGQIDEAVETCRRFIEEYPNTQWTPDVVFWLAEYHYNHGEYKEAEKLFLSIVENYPEHALAARGLYRAGRTAAIQDDYLSAVERFSAVAKQYPESSLLPKVRFAQGDALSQLGEFSRAILAFEEVIKKYPESYLFFAAWGRKGDCQFTLAEENPERYQDAIDSYKAVLDRPLAPADLQLQAEFKIGRCLEFTDAADEAFVRYMNVVYRFKSVAASSDMILWFTRAAFRAAALKENASAWSDAVTIYQRVVDENVPARDEAAKRIEHIRSEYWAFFQ